MKCKNCGYELEQDYTFCPECGTVINEEPNTVIEEGEEYNPIGTLPKKQLTKKKKIMIIVIVAAIIVFLIFFFFILPPKHLEVNQGQDVEMNVGDKIELTVSGKNIDPADYENIVWESSNNKVVKVNNGIIEGCYNRSSFNSRDSEYYEEGEDDDTYLATVTARFIDGIKTWEGEVNVLVSLQPAEFESGQILKEPAGSKDSYIEITPSDTNNAYFYFKSTTNEANDMSFLIKKGEFTTVYVPCDTYEIYEAKGETWYGIEAMFGAQTYYTKQNDTLEFTYDRYWTLQLEAEEGNVTSDELNGNDFPK